MTTICPKCKADNPDTQKFCGECATPLQPSKDISVSFTKTLETPKKELTRDDTIADRYEIIERLDTGGMGSVYRVEDTKIHEDVAIKLIKPEIAADKNTIEHFKQTIPLLQENGYYLPFYFEALALVYFKSGDMT